MTKFNPVLSLLLVAVSSSSFAASATPAALTKTEHKLFRCMRSALDSRRLNESEVAKLSLAVDDYIKGKEQNAVLGQCEDLLKESRSNERQDYLSYQEMFSTLQEKTALTETRVNFFNSIFSPAWDCNTLGVSAGFSLGAGPDVSLDIGVCNGTLGRRVAVVIPAAGIELGLHAGAVLEGQQFTIGDGTPLEFDGDSDYKIGLGLEVDRNIHGDFESTSVQGVGVGGGFAIELFEKGLVIKVSPMSSTRKLDREMKALLLK